MGAVNFSLDPKLVDALQSTVPLKVLVETGTFHGDTVALLESRFEKVFSIELSDALCTDAVDRFAEFPHVQILQGDSAVNLRELELNDAVVLYWLDAHWCVATDTVGELSQCPLIEELKSIGSLNKDSVVLIDDARLFLAPPLAPHEISQWPSFHQVVEQLFAMSSNHELMVVNDVIAFYPKQAKYAMENYAQFYGYDWLVAANCMKQYGSYIWELEKKEIVIQQQGSLIKYQKSEIEQKELIIKEIAGALNAYRLAFYPLRPLRLPCWIVKRVNGRCKEIFRPRLGNLSQYTPRPINEKKLIAQPRLLTDKPKISIVTPSFQQGDYIERTVLSVLEQGYPNLEYFIQDGGSTDNTVTVLKKYESQLLGWVSEEDSGQSQAINRGFANTTGEIMAWLNSDDLLLPGSLETVADYFNCHPNVDVVYGDRLLIDQNDLEIGRWIMPGHNSDLLTWADYVPQETLFWRRRILESVGGQIDESFRFAMDWDLLVRFRDAGAKFAHIPQFLGAFRIHEHQKTTAVINAFGYQEMDRIRERLLGRVPTHKQIRKAVFPYLVKHVLVDLIYRIKTRLGVRKV